MRHNRPGRAVFASAVTLARRSRAIAMETSRRCPVCLVTRSYYLIFAKIHQLLTCSECSTVYVDLLPAVEQVRLLYRDSYQGSTTGYFTKVEKKLRRSRGRIRQLTKYARRGRFLDVGCNDGLWSKLPKRPDSTPLDLTSTPSQSVMPGSIIRRTIISWERLKHF